IGIKVRVPILWSWRHYNSNLCFFAKCSVFYQGGAPDEALEDAFVARLYILIELVKHFRKKVKDSTEFQLIYEIGIVIVCNITNVVDRMSENAFLVPHQFLNGFCIEHDSNRPISTPLAEKPIRCLVRSGTMSAKGRDECFAK